MSPVGIEHEENLETCHHCHLTAPIPLADLIKTHPLRSVVAKGKGENHQESNGKGEEYQDSNGDVSEGKNKGNDNGPIHSLLEEVASKKFRLKKTVEGPSTSEKESPSVSLDRKDKSLKVAKPVHSFLHHVSDASVYKVSENSGGISRSTRDESKDSSSIESPVPKVTKSSGLSSDVVINAKNLNSHNNLSISNSQRHSLTTADRRTPQNNKTLTNSETQTSRTSSVSKVYFTKSRYSASDFSSIFPLNRRHRKRCDKFFCSLPSGLLFAGYGLLIVIGVVVGVALSQRERSFSAQSSAFPRRPNFASARPAPITGGPRERIAIRAPSPRTRITPAGRRRVGSVKRVVPQQNVIPVPAPAPVQEPSPAAPPAQIFRDEDFDYFEDLGLSDPDLSLASQPQPQPLPRPQQVQPTQAFRPVEIEPQFRPQARAPAQEVRAVAQAPKRQQAPSPRRGTSNTFRQEFNNQPQPEDTTPRGQREPEVKIIKSWSNRNADGTFSWGYINTDGSFKNETKGTDCVVRGVYGYIDQTTGERVSFPYESGNPCDPNAPDYYYDYEDGTVNVGGRQVAAQRPRTVASEASRKRS